MAQTAATLNVKLEALEHIDSHINRNRTRPDMNKICLDARVQAGINYAECRLNLTKRKPSPILKKLLLIYKETCSEFLHQKQKKFEIVRQKKLLFPHPSTALPCLLAEQTTGGHDAFIPILHKQCFVMGRIHGLKEWSPLGGEMLPLQVWCTAICLRRLENSELSQPRYFSPTGARSV